MHINHCVNFVKPHLKDLFLICYKRFILLTFLNMCVILSLQDFEAIITGTLFTGRSISEGHWHHILLWQCKVYMCCIFNRSLDLDILSANFSVFRILLFHFRIATKACDIFWSFETTFIDKYCLSCLYFLFYSLISSLSSRPSNFHIFTFDII